MSVSRRRFVAGIGATAAAPFARGTAPGTGGRTSSAPATSAPASSAPAITPQQFGERFDPWLEVLPAALAHNVDVISRLSNGRPVLAVIKNNAYGLGLTTVARALEPLDAVAGFAVVKTEAALALREAGIGKPVLLMAVFADADAPELVARDVRLSLCTDDDGDRAASAAERAGRTARAHVYLDTGMSRMGMPYHRALPWLEGLEGLAGGPLTIEGTFMGFTESEEFDREQLRRFTDVTGRARAAGVELGALHAASSHAVFNFSDAHLDLVRPGIALFGAYPSDAESESAIAALEPAVRLRARVVRVERLRAGDSVSYGRNYIADADTWIATLPLGHTDGYPRGAVDGARVLIGGSLYPVIGAVSASHTIIEVGPERRVEIGDVATLLGPDNPAIHPNAVATATDTSVYDRLMHLSPSLPRVVV